MRHLLASFAVALGLSGALVSAPAWARDVSVSLTWPGISIAPGAEAVFVFRDDKGARVAERRVLLEVGQTRLDASFEDVPSAATALRAGLSVGAGIVAATAPQPIPEAGPAALDALAAQPAYGLKFAQPLRCDGGTVEVARGLEGGLWLRWMGEVIEMDPLIAGRTDWFIDGDNDAWMHPPRPQFRLNGQDLQDCAPVLGQPLLPLTARSRDAGWWLELRADAVRFAHAPDADAPLEVPLPEPAQSPGRMVFADPAITVVLHETLCRDPADRVPHPIAVDIVREGEILTGCGGRPERLLQGGTWQVTSLHGIDIAAALNGAAELTMSFSPAQISGRAACNLYVGDMAIDRDGLGFGEMATTRVACPTALMSLERRFLDALDSVTGFDMAGPDAVVFLAGQTPILTARRDP